MEAMKKDVKMFSIVIFHLSNVIKDLIEQSVWKFQSCATACKTAKTVRTKGSCVQKGSAAAQI